MASSYESLAPGLKASSPGFTRLTGQWLFGKGMLLTVACALSQASLGYDSGITDIIPFVNQHQTNTASVKEFIRSQAAFGYSHTAGIIVGAICTFLAGMYLGRKRSLALGAIAAGIGYIITASSFSPGQLIAGRVISGLGGGFTASLAPIWQVEAADTRERGRLVVVQLVSKLVGQMISSWVGFSYGRYSRSFDGQGEHTEPVSWRFSVAINLILTVALLLLLLVLPESPRWLISKGRHEDARRTIAELRQTSPDDPAVAAELHKMQIPSEYDNKTPKEHWRACIACCSRRKASSASERFPEKRTGWRMTLGAVLQLFAAMGGINTWSYYLPTIVQSYLGLKIRSGDLIVTACTTWLVVCAVLGVFIIERLGRRGTLMFAFTGLFVSSLVLLAAMLGGMGVNQSSGVQTSTGGACIAFLFVFEGFWGVLNPAAWLYQAEINSWSSRAVGSAVATIAMYVGNILSAFYTPALVVSAGTATGAVFLSINFLGMLYTYLLLPETAGRSLEWLDYYNSRKPPVLVIRDPQATKRQWREQMEIMEVDALRHSAGHEHEGLAEDFKYEGATADIVSLQSLDSRKEPGDDITPTSQHDRFVR